MGRRNCLSQRELLVSHPLKWDWGTSPSRIGELRVVPYGWIVYSTLWKMVGRSYILKSLKSPVEGFAVYPEDTGNLL